MQQKTTMKLKIKLDSGAILPTRAHDTDAGLDLYTPKELFIYPNDNETVDLGVHVEIPEGYVGMLKSKSGLMRNIGITTEGTIDAGYSGSVCVTVFNHSGDSYRFDRGDKITQLVVLPCLLAEVEQVDEIASGERGGKGFGSTGK